LSLYEATDLKQTTTKHMPVFCVSVESVGVVVVVVCF